MVGEIRDLETARIDVQAAFKGHFVFSTFHTIDPVGAIARFVDLGLEPYLVAASLESVMAQRLVRRICPSCRRTYSPSHEIITRLDMDPQSVGDREFYYGSE